jgi:hypothetical protein
MEIQWRFNGDSIGIQLGFNWDSIGIQLLIYAVGTACCCPRTEISIIHWGFNGEICAGDTEIYGEI